MASARKRSNTGSDSSEQEIRQQEVLRANRELAAYFKGRRTEREARAALKIIKAFIRDREELDPGVRHPLPGVASSAKAPKERPHKRSTAHRDRRPRTRQVSRHAAKETAARAASSETAIDARSHDADNTPSD
jgi:hypothetical protein